MTEMWKHTIKDFPRAMLLITCMLQLSPIMPHESQWHCFQGLDWNHHQSPSNCCEDSPCCGVFADMAITPVTSQRYSVFWTADLMKVIIPGLRRMSRRCRWPLIVCIVFTNCLFWMFSFVCMDWARRANKATLPYFLFFFLFLLSCLIFLSIAT